MLANKTGKLENLANIAVRIRTLIESDPLMHQPQNLTTVVRKLLLTVSLAFLLLPASVCSGDELVVPQANETVEGDSNNGFPFHLDNEFFSIDSMRYQQLYDAAQFAGVSAPVWITELRFRPNGSISETFSSTLPDIRINLSTTTASPDALSKTFAANIGSDDTVVFDGSLELSSNLTGDGPYDFDIVIPLTTPFPYDPAQGNLLLDVRNFGGGSTTFFDAAKIAGDPISRAYTSVTGNVDSDTAAGADTNGLITKFVFGVPSIEIALDVKPGSDENQINLKQSQRLESSQIRGRGQANSQSAGNKGPVLPVAVLTTDDYDAALTDTTTLLLGDPELWGAVPPLRSSWEDVDGDGDEDLLLHFSVEELIGFLALDEETLFLELTGETLDGIPIVGMDFVTIKL